MKYIIGGIFLVAIFALGLAFSVNNGQLVHINYFLAQGEFQLVYLLGAVFLFGVVLCFSVTSFFYFKLRFHNRRLRSQLKKIKLQLIPLEKSVINDRRQKINADETAMAKE